MPSPSTKSAPKSWAGENAPAREVPGSQIRSAQSHTRRAVQPYVSGPSSQLSARSPRAFSAHAQTCERAMSLSCSPGPFARPSIARKIRARHPGLAIAARTTGSVHLIAGISAGGGA
jgi:hypothetical protein